VAGHDVVVAERLVPRLAVEGGADVHLRPALVESPDAFRGEVDAAIVEVVADGYEGGAVLLEADFLDIPGGVAWGRRVSARSWGQARGCGLPSSIVALEMA
jgi:hypothetical protein